MNTAPQLSAVLGQVATVVRVKSTSLGLWRLDKQASRELDGIKSARQGTGKTSACRLSGAEDKVKAINSKAAEIGNKLKDMTTAYDDKRLLANSMLQTWLGEWGTDKADYDKLVEDFKADAPRLIANALQNKGDYNVDVPTQLEIDEAFSIEFEMSQIPDSSQYHGAGLDSAMNAELQRQFEASVQSAYTAAKLDALKRVAEPLGHLIDRLGVFSKTEDEKSRGVVSSSARLYESTITNVQDIASVFRSFNLTGEKFMDDIADKLDAFEGISIEDIKGSKDLRNHLTAKASDILEGLRDLI